MPYIPVGGLVLGELVVVESIDSRTLRHKFKRIRPR